MGRNGRLKPSKLLTLFGDIGNKVDSFQYHCFDIHGVEPIQTPSLFIDSPGIQDFKDNSST